MIGVIDRFEGSWVVIRTDNKKEILVPKTLIKRGIKEGDLLEIKFNFLKKKTAKRRKRVAKKLTEIF